MGSFLTLFLPPGTNLPRKTEREPELEAEGRKAAGREASGPAARKAAGREASKPASQQASKPASQKGQTVSAIRTEQGAWCATEFGTLPRMRRAPDMPLLPTTMRSAFTSPATWQMASAGEPAMACVSTWTPATAAREPRSSRRERATESEPRDLANSSPPLFSACGVYADTMCSRPPVSLTSSTACRTASAAVSDPSAPTTTVSNIKAPYKLQLAAYGEPLHFNTHQRGFVRHGSP